MIPSGVQPVENPSQGEWICPDQHAALGAGELSFGSSAADVTETAAGRRTKA